MTRRLFPDPIVRIICTAGGIGYFPVGPGSAASVAGVLLYMAVIPHFGVYAAVTVLVTALGFLAADRMEELCDRKDPSCIVVDEVAGILISFAFLPLTWPVIITAFFLFRAFDMFKIYPVNKMDDIPNGVGVMMDDIVAGLYTNLAMHCALWLSARINL